MANPTGRKQPLWPLLAKTAGMIVLVGLIAAFYLVRPYGVTGTTYVAKQLCSCVFLTGRTDASCQGELKPDVDKFSVRIDHAKRSVAARLAIFSSESAYQDGAGCRIVR